VVANAWFVGTVVEVKPWWGLVTLALLQRVADVPPAKTGEPDQRRDKKGNGRLAHAGVVGNDVAGKPVAGKPVADGGVAMVFKRII
jgi:hypothetical protein